MMKRILFSLVFLIESLCLFSQAPEGFNYHAVVRDGGGNPLTLQAVSFRFTIIQGTPAGTSIFQETHNVTTDDFGAVSLVINNGTGKIGTFETIDWGTDSYFLKAELDETGGATYSDMGTSQLLSVPYALYAKAAANGFSGDYNDLINRPVTDGSETKISAGDRIILAGTGTLVNPYIITNGTDGSETRLTAGSHITITGTGTLTNPYIINDAADGSETYLSAEDNLTVSGTGTSGDPYIIGIRKHYIGESFGGGIVFYVYGNGQHGLISATRDQDFGIEWFNGTKRYTNSTGDGLGAGEMNTTLIIALQTEDNPMSSFAAKACADYSVTVNDITYGDWYLPSKYELNLLFFQKDNIGNFSNNYYWSSTEFSSVSAWCQNLSSGAQDNQSKSASYAIRAIRAF
jgi:hypothetical protein